MVFENAVAVVTGGASGLGAATAKLLREKGMKVAIVDIDQYKLDQYATSIGAHGYRVDVTDAAAASSFFDTIEKEIGIPSVLVNCAGIATPSRILGKQGLMSLDFFQKTIKIWLFYIIFFSFFLSISVNTNNQYSFIIKFCFNKCWVLKF
jgi:NAD(P)-dependent dehydrogenase (short-subunit alcohol dehydrogenase family)